MAKAKSAMAHPLYLTADERKLFDALPEKLREGWEVREERGEYEDSEKSRALRAAFMTIQDPSLRKFQEKSKMAKSDAELMRVVQSIDLSGVSAEDIAQMFFALGPDGMGMIVRTQLQEAQKDEELNDVAFISDIRHTFFASAQPVS